MAFDPDEFLKEEKQATTKSSGFDPDAFLKDNLSQEDQFRKQYIEQARRSTGSKALGIGEGLAQSLLKPIKSGVAAAPEIVQSANPLNIYKEPATMTEAGRRLGLETLAPIVERGQSIIEGIKENPIESLLYPTSIALRQGKKDIISAGKSLVPYKPGEQELDKAFRDYQMQQALHEESQNTPEILRKLGAESNKAEFIKDIVPYLIPAGEAKAASSLPPVIGSTRAQIGSALNTLKSGISDTTSGLSEKLGEQLQLAKARVAGATPEQQAMTVLSMTEPEVARHIPIVTRRVAEVVKNAPKTAQEALDAIGATESSLYEQRVATNAEAAKRGFTVNGDQALAEAKAKLNAIPTMTQGQRDAILKRMEPLFEGEHTPQAAQDIQQRLNKEFESQYANGTFDKAMPKNEAKMAIRDSFAGQMDEIGQAITGSPETTYSDIGSLIEVKGSLTDRLNKIKGNVAAEKTGIDTGRTIPGSKGQVVSKVIEKVLSPFQKSQLEKLDSVVNQFFKNTKKAEAKPNLSPDQISSLENKFQGRSERISETAQNEVIKQLQQEKLAKAAKDLELQGVQGDVEASMLKALEEEARKSKMQSGGNLSLPLN